MSNDLCLVDADSPRGFRELAEANGNRVNAGFTELHTAEFYAPAHGAWRLYIDDELLPKRLVDGHEGWVWKPGFYAGTVRADLIENGQDTGRTYLLDVTSDPSKIGQASFQRLVQDILDEDPSLMVGDEPATHALGSDSPTDNISVHYAYLFQHGSAFLAALRSVTQRPRRSLEAIRITVPLSRVRRVDVHTALVMARNGSLASLASAMHDEATAGARGDWRFNVPFSMESLDSAANRCIAALARAVLRRAVHISKVLEENAETEEESQTRTAFRVRWSRRQEFLDAFIRAVDAILSLEPFCSVRREEVTAAGLTAVASDPTYARAQHLAWKVLRPGTAGMPSDSWAWMSPTWDLYEAWCFIRLSRALKEILPTLTWKRARVASCRDCIEGTEQSTRVRLYWQPVFRHRAGLGTQDELWSISKELRPDFVLTVDDSGSKHWIILDAKYSQGRQAVLEAMHSAHVYHDALRRYDEPALRSVLLLPARGDGVDWLRERSFIDAHGVGVVTCSPDVEHRTDIVDELRSILPFSVQSGERRPPAFSSRLI